MLSRRSFLKGLFSAGVVAAIPVSFPIARSVLYPIKSIRGTAPLAADFDDLVTTALESNHLILAENLCSESPFNRLLRRKQ